MYQYEHTTGMTLDKPFLEFSRLVLCADRKEHLVGTISLHLVALLKIKKMLGDKEGDGRFMYLLVQLSDSLVQAAVLGFQMCPNHYHCVVSAP